MISKHRNRAILQLVVALSMTALLVGMFYNERMNLRFGHLNDGWIALGFLFYLATVTMWMVASFSLARAKGYHSDMVGGIFLFLIILGFCFPIAPLVFPGFVIFGLKDKTRERMRRER